MPACSPSPASTSTASAPPPGAACPPGSAHREPDILCLQEVRAPDGALAEVLGEGWHVVHEEASAKGRAGVRYDLSAAPPRPGQGRLGEGRPGEGQPGDGRPVAAV